MAAETLKEGLHEIALDLLVPTKNNTRRIDPTDPKLIELSDSIREKGVIQPVVCRPHPEQAGKYELIAGERRWTASRIAQQETIPAVVRDLDDQAALEITAVENLHRENLAPLEEAEQVALLRDGGFDVEAIARSIGRTKQWVYSRAKIAELSDDWKEAIANPPKDQTWYDSRITGVHNWSAGHLEEVAKAPADIQAKLLKHYTDHCYGIPTIKSVRDDMAQYTRTLGKAPFDLTDETLVKEKGSCVACLERKGAQPDLFGITEVVPAEKDTCLNGPCFQKKILAHGRKRFREEREKNPDTIEIKSGASTHWVNGRYVEAAYSGKGGYYDKCKKTDEDATPAVVTGASGRGQKIFVKLTHAKTQNGKVHQKTIRELRKDLNEERFRTVQRLTEEKIEEIEWEALKKQGFDAWRLIRFLLVIGETESPDFGWGWLRGKVAKRIEAYANKDEDALLAELWLCVRTELLPYPLAHKDVETIAVELGLDWQAIWAEATKDHPEPAEWKGLKASEVPPSKAEAA